MTTPHATPSTNLPGVYGEYYLRDGKFCRVVIEGAYYPQDIPLLIQRLQNLLAISKETK